MIQQNNAEIAAAKDKILAAIAAPVAGDHHQAGITMTALTHALAEHLLRTVTIMGSTDYERDLHRAADIMVTQAVRWALIQVLDRRLAQ